MHGPWLLPCLANCSHHAKRIVSVFPVQTSCHFGRTGPVPAEGDGEMCLTHVEECRCLLYCWFVGCCCFGLNEDQLSICVCRELSLSHLFFHLSALSFFFFRFNISLTFFLSCNHFIFFLFHSMSVILQLLNPQAISVRTKTRRKRERRKKMKDEMRHPLRADITRQCSPQHNRNTTTYLNKKL